MALIIKGAVSTAPIFSTINPYNPYYAAFEQASESLNVKIKLINLKPEDKFRFDGGEYLRLKNNLDNIFVSRAFCYKENNLADDAHGKTYPGRIYEFPNQLAVLWLRDESLSFPVECCQQCGSKLKTDLLSDRFGDWCPNEQCNE